MAAVVTVTCLLGGAGCDSGSSTEKDLAAPADLRVADSGGDGLDASIVLTVDGGVTGVYHYQGSTPQSGADYTIDIDHGANQITVIDTSTTNAYTLAGSFETLASGFLKIVYSSGCNGAGCTPAPGTITIVGTPVTLPVGAHALEAPGYLAVVQTDGQASPLVGVAVTDCVAGMLGSYNLIDLVPVAGDAWASLSLSGSTSTVTSAVDQFPIESDAGTVTGASGPCASGVIRLGGGASGGGQSVYESGANGVLFVSSPTDAASAASLGLAQSNLAVTDLENRSYSTLTFTVTSTAPPVFGNMKIGPSEIAVVKPFLSADANTVDQNGDDWASIALVTITNGLIDGTQTLNTQTLAVQGAALQIGAARLIVLTTGLPGGRGATTTIAVSH